MKKTLTLLLTLLFATLASHQAAAAKCSAGKAGDELSADEMTDLYDCLHPKLVEAYGKRGHEVGAVYGNWQAASLRPVAPGVHSGQYLMTYVNDIGYADYVRFSSDGSQMPVGTVIAKENFTIKSNGKIKRGPLLIMTKTGDADGGNRRLGIQRRQTERQGPQGRREGILPCLSPGISGTGFPGVPGTRCKSFCKLGCRIWRGSAGRRPGAVADRFDPLARGTDQERVPSFRFDRPQPVVDGSNALSSRLQGLRYTCRIGQYID